MSKEIISNSKKISESISKLESYYSSMELYQAYLNLANIIDSKGTTVNELNSIIENLRINIKYRLQIMEKLIMIIKSFERKMQEADEFPS